MVVYLCLGTFYAFSDSAEAKDSATAGMRQYPDVHEFCEVGGVAPGCHQPDPYLLPWNK